MSKPETGRRRGRRSITGLGAVTHPASNPQSKRLSGPPGTTQTASRRFLVAGVIALAGALRFGGVDALPEDWDAVDFLLGVEDFDLSRMQPHLPGYPLYMLLATFVSRLGLSPACALEAVGAAAGTLTVLVTYHIVRTRVAPLVALLVATLLAVQPALVAEAPRMHSDTLGLFSAALSLLFLCRGWTLTGGILAGLTLGVRLAYAPLIAGLLLFLWVDARRSGALRRGKRRTGRLAAGTALGLCAWSIPFLVFHGPDVVAEGADFLRGHFFQWGGTPFSVETPGLLPAVGHWLLTLARVMTGSRPTGLLGVCAVGLTGVILLAGLLRALTERSCRESVTVRGACWLVLPFLVWLVVGQNPSNFRHALPVALCAVPLVPLGWSRVKGGLLAVGLIAVLYAVSSGSYLARSRGVPVPADALARYLENREESDNRFELLYCGASFRFLRWRDVHYRLEVTRALDVSGVRRDVNSRIRVPEEVLVSSEVERLPRDSRPMIAFTAPGFLGPRRLELHRFLVRRGEGLLYELELPDARTK